MGSFQAMMMVVPLKWLSESDLYSAGKYAMESHVGPASRLKKTAIDSR
jgi:hypothetical protein